MSNDGDSEFDFLELPTGGISVEDLEEEPTNSAVLLPEVYPQDK